MLNYFTLFISICVFFVSSVAAADPSYKVKDLPDPFGAHDHYCSNLPFCVRSDYSPSGTYIAAVSLDNYTTTLIDFLPGNRNPYITSNSGEAIYGSLNGMDRFVWLPFYGLDIKLGELAPGKPCEGLIDINNYAVGLAYAELEPDEYDKSSYWIYNILTNNAYNIPNYVPFCDPKSICLKASKMSKDRVALKAMTNPFNPDSWEPFTWTKKGGFVPFSEIPGCKYFPDVINENSVTAGRAQCGNEYFLGIGNAANKLSLKNLGSSKKMTNILVKDINEKGQIVFKAYTDNIGTASVYVYFPTHDKVYDLNELTQKSFTKVRNIDDQGRILVGKSSFSGYYESILFPQ